jgi:hypothetical protein
MKLSHVLIGAAILLELAHWRVTSGNTDASLAGIEGALANFDEVTGPNLRVGYILGAIGLYMAVKG